MKRTVSIALAALLAVPLGTAHAGTNDDAFRQQQPPPGKAANWVPPTPLRFTGPGGLQVILVEKHTLPSVSMALRFDLGDVSDPAGKEGMTALCMDLLTERTSTLDEASLADRLADLGSSLSSGGGEERSSVRLWSLKGKLEPTLDLLFDVVTHAGFTQESFDRLRNRSMSAVASQRGSAAGAARRVSRVVLHGASHPLGRVTTSESLQRITLDDCRAVQARLKPNRAVLEIAGDLSRLETEALLATRVTSWKGDAPRLPLVRPPAPLAGRVFLVDVPGAPQSSIVVEEDGPARDARDFAATSLMNQILGGGFDSRINMNLREKNGFTYGARAGLAYRKSGSVFSVTSSVRTDATVKALREVAAELARMRAEPVHDDELLREQTSALLALPARFATAEGALAAADELVFFHLPSDTWAQWAMHMKSTTAATLHEAARQHLHPERMKIVIVGDARTIRDDVKKLVDDNVFGLTAPGGLVELDVDGRAITHAPSVSP